MGNTVHVSKLVFIIKLKFQIGFALMHFFVFSVFTHMTHSLATVAIRHVGVPQA